MSQPNVGRDPHDDEDIPCARDNAVIPFEYLRDSDKITGYLLGGAASIKGMLFGHQSQEEPPNDPLTSWTALAHMGEIELCGNCLDPKFDREQRLELAKVVLNPGEWLRVETIAVPRRYRAMAKDELVVLIRSGESWEDGLWAYCWLILTGCSQADDWPFDKGPLDEHPEGEAEELLLDAYAASKGVMSLDDELGWVRVGRTYDAGLIVVRPIICRTHYEFNGPPPYEQMQNTVPMKPGWRQLTQAVFGEPTRTPPLTKEAHPALLK
jgi:hypothetical protein